MHPTKAATHLSALQQISAEHSGAARGGRQQRAAGRLQIPTQTEPTTHRTGEVSHWKRSTEAEMGPTWRAGEGPGGRAFP